MTVRFGLTEVRLTKLDSGCGTLLTGLRETGAAERLRLHIVRRGRIIVDTAEGDAVLEVGEAVFLLADEASRLQADAACELLTIAAPPEVARNVWPRRSATTVQRVSRSAVLLLPVAAFAARVLQEPMERPSSVSRYYVERLLHEMLQGLLVDASRLGALQQTPEPFQCAMAVIAARHADPELSAASIADEANLSLRQLEREFRKNGTTIRREIRRARIDQAGRMLRDPRYDALSVDQVAQFVGFSGGSSLARAMAASGMPSPTTARVQQPAAATGIPEATTSIPFPTGS